MRKAKGQYGYDNWTDLTAKRPKAEASKASSDPSAGIMDMMKQMYEDGDDTMKKAIGEAMLKSRSGEADKESRSSVPFGGYDDLDDKF